MANGPADGFLPVRLIGSNPDGSERFIADFTQGLVIKGMNLVDVKTGTHVAMLTKLPGAVDPETGGPVFVWQVSGTVLVDGMRVFYYLFMQVMPSDAPKTLEIPGSPKQILH